MAEPRYHDEPIKLLVTCPRCSHAYSVEIKEDLLPNHAGSERFYKLAEVQKILGVSRRTIRQWIYDRKLVATKPSDGASKGAPWFVSASALEDFRRKNKR